MPFIDTKRLLVLVAVAAMVCASILSHVQPAAAAATANETWDADYFPNIPLITHEGKKVRFFDDLLKDKVVAVNFIFTRCPDACPLETARLLEVQRILGDRVGKDVFMYSISIDPEYDTPERLKTYTEQYKIGPGWTFLTGKKDDIWLLRQKLGLFDIKADNEDLSTHTLSMIVGNQSTGKWMKTTPFQNPYILATQIGSWLHNWKLPPKAKQAYDKAPTVRNISKGESLFRTRCAACHTIGAEHDSLARKRSIGPDLMGVTATRDRTWLIRWMAEPDKMIAEKDPLAMALLAAYNNIAMPNLRLTAQEIQFLITYIEEESIRKVKKHEPEYHFKHQGEGGHAQHVQKDDGKGHDGGEHKMQGDDDHQMHDDKEHMMHDDGKHRPEGHKDHQ